MFIMHFNIFVNIKLFKNYFKAMKENPLVSWLSRIDITRVIHYFESQNITEI